MTMNRFAILAAFVSLCAFAASPLKAQEPTTGAPAATTTTPAPGPTESATEKMSGMMEKMPGMMKNMPAMMKNMPEMMKNMPDPVAKAMENFKLEDMKSMMGGLCKDGDCKFEMPAK
jgi:hypothetical protein